MDDKELARLLQMSQGPLTPNQEKVLVSHFGLVASELVVKRRILATLDVERAKICALLDSDGSELSFKINEVLERD